jgi:hypothetical protein
MYWRVLLIDAFFNTLNENDSKLENEAISEMEIEKFSIWGCSCADSGKKTASKEGRIASLKSSKKNYAPQSAVLLGGCDIINLL